MNVKRLPLSNNLAVASKSVEAKASGRNNMSEDAAVIINCLGKKICTTSTSRSRTFREKKAKPVSANESEVCRTAG